MRFFAVMPLVLVLWTLRFGLPSFSLFPVPLDSWPVIWWRTVSIAIASGVGAVAVGALLARSRMWAVVLVAALPPWLLAWSWATLDGPASVVEGWFPAGVPVLLAHLISGTALCVVFLRGYGSNASAFEAARLSGASVLRRWWMRIGLSLVPLSLGGVLTALRAALDTTSWDLARWPGLANELRAALEAGVHQSAVGAFAPWFAMLILPVLWCSSGRKHWASERDEPAHGMWILLGLLPIALATLRFASDLNPSDFLQLHGQQFLPDGMRLMVIAAGGGFSALVARVLLDASPRWSHCGVATWGMLYILPAPLYVVVVGDVGLVAGLMARVMIGGWIVGYLAGLVEDPTQRDARHLEAAVAQRYFGMGLPRFRLFGFGALAALMLALGELTVAARLAQPGDDPLAMSLLSALHYQRPGVVLLAMMPLLLAGASLAIATRGRFLLCCMAWVLVSCSGEESQSPVPILGGNGLTPGRFAYPRAMDIDQSTNTILVVDKRARIQRIALDGAPVAEWSTPTRKNGNPTGIFVDTDGTIFVADTHEHRILVYEPNGDLRDTFGDYGEQLGQFIYPTDIARDGEGRLWVSEYGGNDRVQVFAEDFTPLFVAAKDQEFRRPQSLLWCPEHDVMVMSEANGHCLHVISSAGQHVRTIGGPGYELGQFSYPYGLARSRDGRILVAEFGGCRVQELSLDATSFKVWSGDDSNALRYPWAVGYINQRLLVLDSGNHRILDVDIEALGATP